MVHPRRARAALLAALAPVACAGSPPPPPSSAISADEPAEDTSPTAADSVPSDDTLFGAGVISTRHYELNAAFTPEGDTVFFTLSSPNRQFRDYTILYATKRGNAWSAPRVAPFSGAYSDADPLVSPDGSRVYFISDRPTATKPGGRDFDLWYVERTERGFGEPVNLGAPINTDKDEFYVSVTTAGTIYFSASREGGVGSADIYRSELRDGSYQTPEPLPEPVNSPGPEFDPYVAPDESYVVFASLRADTLGSADLYISWNRRGSWTAPENLGPTINSSAFEFCPIVSPDGQHFFYTSEKRRDPAAEERTGYTTRAARYDRIDNGLGNIYRVPFSSLPSAPAD